MIYAVVFDDDDRHADMRAKHMSRHLTFLEENSPPISSAGPLKDCADGRPAGGLWLVSARGEEAVRALIEQDPFWSTGLRKSVRILEWTRVFADGRRQI